VVSLDPGGDEVLAGLDHDGVGGATAVDSAAAERLWGALHAFSELIDHLLDPQRRPAVLSGDDPELHVVAEALREVPEPWWPVDTLAAATRALVRSLGMRRGADAVYALLEALEPPPALALSSGLAAQRATAALWARPVREWPSNAHLQTVSDAALEGAAAAGQGMGEIARGRLADALTLLFHRERHAEVESSPLVASPAHFLARLNSNRVLLDLSGPLAPPVARSTTRARPRRVAVVTGSYGDFHLPVAQALSTEAEVIVSDLPRTSRLLRAKYLHADFLEVLHRVRNRGLPTDGSGDDVVRLWSSVSECETVFSDWCDRSTVLLSHLVRDDQRLVVRLHSLDALDPWFPLVNWSRVGHVIVVSEPFRRLVTAMLEARRFEVPVSIVPNVVPVDVMDQDKSPEARLTLGMVGWGRRVKDPLWALDLLERDSSWRLVLIGSDMVAGQSAAAQEYTAVVRRRLRSEALRHRVRVLGHVDDVATALRDVGVILSASRRESWHAGLVEGAASGAVPVVRDWPLLAPLGGAAEVYPSEWVVRNLDEAEARVRLVTEPATWDRERRRAQDWVRRAFDPEAVVRRYREIILTAG
jgi:glycosyltransferase involved in cell wall biosynthesis